MNKKLSKRDFMYICLMLFGLFFGAGNLMFPSFLGKEAGSNAGLALMFFSVTAIIFPILGVIAVAKSHGLNNLSKRVGPLFALLFTASVYLAIGPGLGIPRAGSMPFEMAISPYLPANFSVNIARLIYTLVFFLVAYWLCLNPNKMVNRMGKFLTPMLLILIALMFVGILTKDTPIIATPVKEYATNPMVKGFLEGYNTMDTIAALNFGLVIALAMKTKKIEDEKNIVRLTIKAGVVAGLFLLLIYAMLTYVGSATSNLFVTKNGAEILTQASHFAFGSLGSILVAAIFTLACLTTCVGLITSTGQYFTTLTNKLKYQQWVIIWTVLSFLIANFGLNTILSISVPVLVAIYPISLTLIILALTDRLFNSNKYIYKATIYVVSILSIVEGLKTAGIKLFLVTDLFQKLPYYKTGLGWVLPTVVVYIIGVIVSKIFKK